MQIETLQNDEMIYYELGEIKYVCKKFEELKQFSESGYGIVN